MSAIKEGGVTQNESLLPKFELSTATRWASLAGACLNFRPMLFLHTIYYSVFICSYLFLNPFSL